MCVCVGVGVGVGVGVYMCVPKHVFPFKSTLLLYHLLMKATDEHVSANNNISANNNSTINSHQRRSVPVFKRMLHKHMT